MPIDITVIGGGMIVHDQILPSLYQLQRLGTVGNILICAQSNVRIKDLVNSPALKAAFPGMGFKAYPPVTDDSSKTDPAGYRKFIGEMKPGNMVICATPDHLHYDIIKFALEHDQHVMTVKPLVLKHAEALNLEKLAHARGLFVGVEYHKRFDTRALEVRKGYRAGRFGEFRMGEAKLIEPYNYRHSNFQNWFTCENTDPFVYIGCHYVDLTNFITGLKPVQVSVQGVKGKFPNGNVGYLWSAGRVVFENGGILSVINGLGYPDEAAGSNDQGMTFFCESAERGGLISHNDQFRGVAHSYADGKTKFPFRFVSPDYMRLVPWQGEGLKPVGYGYGSIEASVQAAQRVSQLGTLAQRQVALDQIDSAGLIATPANSSFNELVIEAARLSILNDGRNARIEYGSTPSVRLV